MKKDNYNEYADAKRSGLLKKEKPKTEKLPPIIPNMDSKGMGISKWIYRALVVGAGLILGFKGTELLNQPVEKSPVVSPLPVEPKTKIVYKDRIVYKNKYIYVDKPPIIKWKERIIYQDKIIVKWKDKIKYIKDPKCQKLDATYRRRAKMLDKFYSVKLGPGEKQILTFKSNCPGFNNAMVPLNL